MNLFIFLMFFVNVFAPEPEDGLLLMNCVVTEPEKQKSSLVVAFKGTVVPLTQNGEIIPPTATMSGKELRLNNDISIVQWALDTSKDQKYYLGAEEIKVYSLDLTRSTKVCTSLKPRSSVQALHKLHIVLTGPMLSFKDPKVNPKIPLIDSNVILSTKDFEAIAKRVFDNLMQYFKFKNPKSFHPMIFASLSEMFEGYYKYLMNSLQRPAQWNEITDIVLNFNRVFLKGNLSIQSFSPNYCLSEYHWTRTIDLGSKGIILLDLEALRTYPHSALLGFIEIAISQLQSRELPRQKLFDDKAKAKKEIFIVGPSFMNVLLIGACAEEPRIANTTSVPAKGKGALTTVEKLDDIHSKLIFLPQLGLFYKLKQRQVDTTLADAFALKLLALAKKYDIAITYFCDDEKNGISTAILQRRMFKEKPTDNTTITVVSIGGETHPAVTIEHKLKTVKIKVTPTSNKPINYFNIQKPGRKMMEAAGSEIAGVKEEAEDSNDDEVETPEMPIVTTEKEVTTDDKEGKRPPVLEVTSPSNRRIRDEKSKLPVLETKVDGSPKKGTNPASPKMLTVEKSTIGSPKKEEKDPTVGQVGSSKKITDGEKACL